MKRRRKPQQAGVPTLFEGAVESGPDRDTTSRDTTSPIREDQPSFDLAEDTSPMTASQQHDNNDSAVMDSPAEQATDDTLSTNPHDEGRELFAMPAGAHPDDDTIGKRLRAAREARGLSIDEVGARLRLPQRVIASLESGDLASIEHDVYLRGYLSSYTRLLDLPLETLRDNLDRERRPTQPPLVATGRISHSRYLFQRYSVPAVYVVLTGLIVAPAIWLASHGGLERNLARVTTLDTDGTNAATTSTPLELAAAPNAASTGAPSSEPAATQLAVAPPQPHADSPLMASMALPNIKHEPAPEPVAPPAAAATAGKYQVTLKLKEASWVEIVGADGRKLEFGLLPAGAERSYGTDQAVSVRLGNANGAEVDVNGKPVDLQPFRRANVAHVKLVDGNAVAPGASPSAN